MTEPTEKGRPSAEIELSCQHRRIFPAPCPRKDETVWCSRCGDYRTVAAVLGVYRVKCRHCRLSRPYSYNLLTAGQAMMSHRRTYGTHVVDLWQGEKRIDTYGNTADQTLPYGSGYDIDDDQQIIPF